MHAALKYGAKPESAGTIRVDFIDGSPVKDQIIKIVQEMNVQEKSKTIQTIGIIGRYYSNEERRAEAEFYLIWDKANEEILENFNNYFKTDEEKGKVLTLDLNRDKAGIVMKKLPYFSMAIRANQSMPGSKPRSIKIFSPKRH